MPVRIYDIAKKFGLENKEILVKAKSLGIAAARVPSSSLDKISAEWLEGEILKDHPDLAARLAPPPAAPPPPPPPATEPVRVISPPPAPPSPPVVQPPEAEPRPVPQAPAAAPPAAVAPAPTVEKPAAPPLPATRIGQKVGFIQLPSRPQPPRLGEKVGSVKLPPARAAAPRRPERARDAQRGEGRTPPAREGEKTASAPPRFTVPDTAEAITLKPPIIVRELAAALKQKPFIIIGDLMKLGVFATVNQAIDEKIAQQLCAKYGFRFEVEKRERGAAVVHAVEKKVELDFEDKPEQLKPRPPVVTIMGHVDHGKTTLLDVIRKSNVAAGEAGGITQHIGAYTISVPHPQRKEELAQITFLDTPGHAAFSSMRARGANVTDIVVLVVAANDGVMPQTLEALSHARAAKVPLLVAVNKMDHPNANPMKVRQQLQDKGLAPDDWGGDTIFVDVSALTRQGVEKLLEMILLQADLLELKANPDRRANGNVIESGVEPGGPTATVLVRKGTLRLGDTILCGEYYGRVRALINEEGKRLKEAGPSVAVRVLGLNGVPEAGLEFSVLEDEKTARDVAEQRLLESRAEGPEDKKVTLENLFATLAASQTKALKVVVKADTQGSVEAIVDALKKIEAEKVSLEVIHNDVGAITENDVALASASKAVILGFHTRVDSTAAEKSKREGVQVKLYAVIYELIDEVREAMAGLLEPIIKETVVGAAEVRKIFELSKGAPVAGSIVSNGRIIRGKVRVRRRKDIIYEGVTQSLRRFQDEVNEVRAGMECGIRIEGFGDFQVGDVVECYTIEKVAAKL
ncbi:MAG: translation initiation factor IF-2 [Verrucomicrobia bacterium]|nr:translation initiation factor IF-2 [Verrucomicrobiota bacterium]MDE3099606.1 translation initiation factor IF-2 [Verrucomicrobiota bacterium]